MFIWNSNSTLMSCVWSENPSSEIRPLKQRALTPSRWDPEGIFLLSVIIIRHYWLSGFKLFLCCFCLTSPKGCLILTVTFTDNEESQRSDSSCPRTHTKVRATLRLQCNQNLLASLCVEGSGWANEHNEKNKQINRNGKKKKQTEQNRKNTPCFSSGLFLDGEVYYITVLSVLFNKKKKYVEYSLIEMTVWEQTKNVQGPQTALRNAGIFHGYLSSEEKGEDSEFKNMQFTFQTSLSSSSSCLACAKHLYVSSKNIYWAPSVCLHAGPWILQTGVSLFDNTN